MTPLLRVTHLCKEVEAGGFLDRRRVRILDDVSFQIEPGEILGLAGESGSGKTTLARCLMRLVEPSSGTILFEGVDILSLRPAALRRLRCKFQMVFQDAAASLNNRMSVGQALSEPLAALQMGTRSEREERVLALLDLVGLEHALVQRPASRLSGGQQQRLVIARALALRPRLLIADEPVSALDASVQAQVLNLLADLRGRLGLTVLLISHSLPVIHYLCSRVLVMYLGKLVEESPVEEFFEQPRHPYSQALLESVPGLDLSKPARRPVLSGEVPSPASPPPGCRFHPRCPSAMARCREEIPGMKPTGRTGRAACFLYE